MGQIRFLPLDRSPVPIHPSIHPSPVRPVLFSSGEQSVRQSGGEALFRGRAVAVAWSVAVARAGGPESISGSCSIDGRAASHAAPPSSLFPHLSLSLSPSLLVL